jgi:hypothetical protein
MMAVGQPGAGQKNVVVDVSPSPSLNPLPAAYSTPASRASQPGLASESGIAWSEIGVQWTIGVNFGRVGLSLATYNKPGHPFRALIMHRRANGHDGAPEQQQQQQQPPFLSVYCTHFPLACLAPFSSSWAKWRYDHVLVYIRMHSTMADSRYEQSDMCPCH